MKRLVIILLALLLTGCGAGGAAKSVTSDTLNVEKVEGLPENFILGMDASCVPSLEAGGVRYYDHEGLEKDVFRILSENGVNYIRVRIWNEPYDENGHGYGGGNCDLANAVNIGRRAAEFGMKLLVNFHYSDFWADPGKQQAPKAWQGMDIEQKCEAVYAYTRDSLETLAEAGADIGIVQIGNETNGAICGEDSWENMARIMNAGARAVREALPEAQVALHFTNPEKAGSYEYYAGQLEANAVDYDIFASSYYPYWHGSLENLSAVLGSIAQDYGKKLLVAETSYAYTAEDTDFHHNTIGSGAELPGYEFSCQGQADMLRDIIACTVDFGGMGVVYWEGTWISAGGSSRNENSALWEKHGSGWASSYAAEYDPEDAGQWYGGCAVDNQAFFDENGRATEALKIFALIK